MADAPIGVTETTATSYDLVSELVQMELSQEANLVHTCQDFSGQVRKGADSVKIPRFDSFTAQDKTENTAVELQAITASADQLDLTTYKATPVRLEDIADLQAVVNMEAEIVARLATALVRAIEADARAALDDVSSSAPDHDIDSDGYSLAAVDVLEAKRLLDVQKVPKGDRYMAIHPTQCKEILQISDFIQQDRYPQQQALMNGEIGMLYGFKVIESVDVEADKPLFYHKSHCAFARQMAPKFEKQRAPLVNFATDYALSCLYGFKVLDAGVRGVRITVQ